MKSLILVCLAASAAAHHLPTLYEWDIDCNCRGNGAKSGKVTVTKGTVFNKNKPDEMNMTNPLDWVCNLIDGSWECGCSCCCDPQFSWCKLPCVVTETPIPACNSAPTTNQLDRTKIAGSVCQAGGVPGWPHKDCRRGASCLDGCPVEGSLSCEEGYYIGSGLSCAAPVDCKVGEWLTWGPCKDGFETRYRTITQKNNSCGTPCGPLHEKQQCCTPRNATVSEWSAWSECNGTTNYQRRTRTITTSSLCGGSTPQLLEELVCTCTPRNATVSEWSAWSECNGTTYKQRRTRTITNYALCGGSTPQLFEEEQCVCTPRNATVSEWSAWSECNSTSNMQTRTRTITTSALCGGSTPSLSQVQQCSSAPTTAPVACTPHDCVVSNWSEWQGCNTTQPTFKTRTRTIVTAEECGGLKCPQLFDEVLC